MPDDLYTRSLYVVPPGAKVIVITHLLELPLDLQLPDASTVSVFGDRADIIEHLTVEELAEIRGPGFYDDSIAVENRITFRRMLTRARAPGWAADRSFDPWAKLLLDKNQWRRRQRALRQLDRHGWPEWVTVVGASRWIPAQVWPADRTGQDSRLAVELDASLRFLNDHLLSLSLVRRDPRIAPIARGDLPFVCPILIETYPNRSRPFGVSTSYPIHEAPALSTDDVVDEAVAQTAIALSRHAREGTDPFFLFYELMQHATLEAMSRYNTRAAITLGTAFEVLVSTVIRAVDTAAGRSEAQIEGVLGTGFRNVVQDHLGRRAHLDLHLDDPNDPFGAWWSGGYALRNAVVHRSHEPTDQEVHSAYLEVNAAVVAIRTGLQSDNQTRALGDTLGWGPVEY